MNLAEGRSIKLIPIKKKDFELIKDNYQSVSSCDGVLVTNITKNDIQDYIGANSLIEMAFAHIQDKPIYLLNDVPLMDYTDEIKSMKPICLSGKVEDIKSYMKMPT